MRVALPWWDGALRDARESGTAPELPAMRWLLSRAARRIPAEKSWRDWLLARAGFDLPIASAYPAGPCVRAITNLAAATDGTWAVAQLVHLDTAIDHLRMAGRGDVQVSPQEAAALHATLQAHLAGSGYALEIGSSATWTLHCPEPVECRTVEPAELAGSNIRDFLPAGRDGRAIRVLMNELQMLLHEHPVNEQRLLERRPVINALWLWGFGRAIHPRPRPLPRLLTDDAWLTGLWLLHDETPSAIGQAATIPAEPPDAVLIAMARPPATSPQDALAAADEKLLALLSASLRNGQRRSVEIHAGAQVIQLDAWSRWRFWRRPHREAPVAA